MKIKLLILAMLLFTQSALAAAGDVDQDGIADSIDKYPFDYDNDGLPDIWEKRVGLRYDVANANGDPDHDGVKNIHEYERGTDPLVSDATGERVQPEFLRPVERTWIKVSVWILGAVFFFLLVFVTYKSKIFTFKDKQNPHPMRPRVPLYRRKATLPYPARVQGHSRRAFRTSYQPRPFVRQGNVQRPLVRRDNLQRPFVRQGNVQRPVVRRDNLQRPFVRQGNVQRPVVRAGNFQTPFVKEQTRVGRPRVEGQIQPSHSEKNPDVFERLSSQVHEYNTSERTIKKLSAIR